MKGERANQWLTGNGGREQELTAKGSKKIAGAMEIICVSVVVVPQLHAYNGTHQIVLLKLMDL